MPCSIQPYPAARSAFSVITGVNQEKISVITPKVAVVTKQRKMNLKPISLNPKIRIGALISTINKPAGSSVTIWISDAAPLTPPPTILLGIKNICRLNAYEQHAKTIKK